MSSPYKEFLKDAERVSFDLEHRKKLNFNIGKYKETVVKGKSQFMDLPLAKKRGNAIKSKVIDNLEKYLNDFETNFKKNGGKLIWATNAEEALERILEIVLQEDASYVVKSKSMISEEIHLNDNLTYNKVEPIETDLGEFIVQVAGEPPYHIVTPAMHKSKEEVTALFAEKFGVNSDATPEDITKFVRKELRDKFQNAKVGITGANFIIADTGSFALTENEGNGVLTISKPKVHIAIAGFEKLIASYKNLHLFWPLLGSHGTGQNISVYNSIMSGPKSETELDGPEQVYFVIIDNGRSKLLDNIKLRSALYCIKCGACLNECPVYKNVGGYTYKSVYTGPIGSIISPYIGNKYEEFKHLTFASSLCGRCSEVCPVGINLSKLLLIGRNEYVNNKQSGTLENISFKVWKHTMLNRSMMEFGSSKLKNKMIKIFFKKGWGKRRDVPQFTEKSFNKIWKEQSQ